MAATALQEDVDAEKETLAHHARYQYLLPMIDENVRIPEIKLLDNMKGDVHQAGAVNMVLDVSNSGTCGILNSVSSAYSARLQHKATIPTPPLITEVSLSGRGSHCATSPW